MRIENTLFKKFKEMLAQKQADKKIKPKHKTWIVGQRRCQTGINRSRPFVDIIRQQIIPTSKYIPAGENRNVPIENR